MTDGTIPPGWYPEPSGAAGERWWDGARWTEHARPFAPTGNGPNGTSPVTSIIDPAHGAGPTMEPAEPAMPAGAAAPEGTPSTGMPPEGGDPLIPSGSPSDPPAEPSADDGERTRLIVGIILATIILLAGIAGTVWLLTGNGVESLGGSQAASEEPASDAEAQGMEGETLSDDARAQSPPSEGTEGDGAGQSDAADRVEPLEWFSFEEPGGPWVYRQRDPTVVEGTLETTAVLEVSVMPSGTTIDEFRDELVADGEAEGAQFSGEGELDVPGADRALQLLAVGEDAGFDFEVGFLFMAVADRVVFFGISFDGHGALEMIERSFGSVEIDPEVLLAELVNL